MSRDSDPTSESFDRLEAVSSDYEGVSRVVGEEPIGSCATYQIKEVPSD